MKVSESLLALLKGHSYLGHSSLKSAVEFDPLSPDVDPLDFSFWDSLEERIHAGNPNTAKEFRAGAWTRSQNYLECPEAPSFPVARIGARTTLIL